MGGALCSGNLVLDILVRPVDRIAWGTTTLVDSIEQNLGGNGANTSYTLARLGMPARLLGMVGSDAFGEFVLRKLQSAGVDTGGVRRSTAPTASTVAVVNTRGDRMFLHRFGSSAETFFDPAEFAAEITPRISHYHLGSPFGLPRLRPFNAALLKTARDHGLTTSLDTHWDSAGRWLRDLSACLPHTDILFVNEDEARMLTGNADPAEAARVLRDHGAAAVVIKLGRSGCAVFRGDGVIRSPGFEVPVVDTTGAGDCFAGGFLAALDRGRDWEEAARFANAVGALTIQKLGAVEGVLSYEETEAWMRS